MYGSYFFQYLKDNDLHKLLFIMGETLDEFLGNLDYLHQHLQDT